MMPISTGRPRRTWSLIGLLPLFLVATSLYADLTGTEIDESNFGTTEKTNRFTAPAGSTQLDNGMIVKWGRSTVAALSSSTAVSFPTAFPTEILSVELSPEGAALSGASATVSNISRLGFTINIQCLALSGPIVCTSSTNVRWSARGY